VGAAASSAVADFCRRWAAPGGTVMFALLVVQANTGMLSVYRRDATVAQRRRRLARNRRRDRSGAGRALVLGACWHRITAPPAGSPSICRRAPASPSRTSASAGSTCPSRRPHSSPEKLLYVRDVDQGSLKDAFARVDKVAEVQRKRGPLLIETYALDVMERPTGEVFDRSPPPELK